MFPNLRFLPTLLECAVQLDSGPTPLRMLNYWSQEDRSCDALEYGHPQ
jgi:hypothetical protein